MISKRRFWILFCIISLLIIIVLITLIIFPPFEKYELSLEKVNEGRDIFNINSQISSKPTIRSTLADFLNIPLDFKWFNVCIKYNGELLIDNELANPDQASSRLIIYLRDQEILSIQNMEKKCFVYSTREDFTTSIKIKLSRELMQRREQNTLNAILNSTMEGDATPELKELFVKRSLVILALLTIAFLFAGILSLVKKELKEV